MDQLGLTADLSDLAPWDVTVVDRFLQEVEEVKDERRREVSARAELEEFAAELKANRKLCPISDRTSHLERSALRDCVSLRETSPDQRS